MKSYPVRFNTYYLVLASATLFLAAGCSSPKSKFAKEQQATIRLYLEGNRQDTASTGTVLVTHDHFPITIERDPALTEADLRRVQMINEPGPNGGYSIELVFNEHGTLMLDMLTTAYKNRHIVVFSQFPTPGYKAPKEKKKSKKKEDDDDNANAIEDMQPPLPIIPPESETPGAPRTSGWLAAVQIKGRIASGIFIFSPDATKEEASRIVIGLKNVLAYKKSLGRD